MLNTIYKISNKKLLYSTGNCIQYLVITYSGIVQKKEYKHRHICVWASLVAQMMKNPQCRRRGFDPWVRKILLEKGMVPHSSIFAQKIPQTEEPGGLQSMGSQRVRYDRITNSSVFFFIYLHINYFALVVQLKLTKHRKSTTVQFNKKMKLAQS